VHAGYLGGLVHSLHFLCCCSIDNGLPDLSCERLVRVSRHHELVSFPVPRDQLLGFQLFVDELRALRQAIIGHLDLPNTPVCTIHGVAAEVQELAEV